VEQPIVTAVVPTDGLPFYEVADGELGPGASFGNGHAWINTGTDGRIHTFFCTDVGEEVAGPLIVRYGSAETRMSGTRGMRRADVPLSPVGVGRFLIHPFHQQHLLDLPGGVEVEETVFLPRVAPGQTGNESVACYMVSLRNGSQCARRIGVYALARLGGRRRPGRVCSHPGAGG